MATDVHTNYEFSLWNLVNDHNLNRYRKVLDENAANGSLVFKIRKTAGVSAGINKFFHFFSFREIRFMHFSSLENPTTSAKAGRRKYVLWISQY